MLSLKKLIAVFAALAILGGLAVVAMAATTADQAVAIVVPSIVYVNIVGGTVTLNIADIDVAVSDSTTGDLIYAHNTEVNKKVSAKGGSIPTGITLTVQVADGSGPITLTTGDQQVVGSFAKTKATKDITYTASASVNAAITTHNITVTYTITDV